MIVDVRTYIWTHADQLGPEVLSHLRERLADRWLHLNASPSAHEQSMGRVDGVFVHGFRSDLLGAHLPNELVADFVMKARGRRIGIAGIDPMAADAADQMDTAIGLGLAGISISPVWQGFHPSHSKAMDVYDRAMQASMPLFVAMDLPLTHSTKLEFARPVFWDEIARDFPKLPIVIAQLGHPWIEETLVLLGKHRNVFADVSCICSRPWQLFNAMQSAVSLGVMDRLLFASGFPQEKPEKAIESLYSINTMTHATQLPGIPRSQVRGIVERDALQCLGIVGEFNRPVASTDGQPDDDLDEGIEFQRGHGVAVRSRVRD